MRFLLSFLLLTQPAYAALDFVTDDLVNCQSPTAFEDLGDWTMAVWVYADSFPGEGILLDMGDSAGDCCPGPIFSINSTSGDIFCRGQQYDGADNPQSTSSTTIATGAWYFLACIFDGSTAPNIYTGTLTSALAEVSYASESNGAGSAVSYAGNTLSLGERVFHAGAPLDGKIAMVYWWSNQVTAAELEQIRRATMHRVGRQIDTSTQVLVLDFDDQPAGSAANGDTLHNGNDSGNNCTGDDGANNAGLTWLADGFPWP